MVQIIQQDTHPSEAQLIGSAVAGDKSAFAALFEIHNESLVKNVSEELCQGDIEKAADIVQQAFLDVFHTIRDIDRTLPFAESVMDAARDRMISREREDTGNMHELLSFSEISMESMIAPDGDPADRLSALQETHKRIAALETLATIDKAANKYAMGIRYLFEMCEKGLSADDIARRERVSSRSVQQAVKDACTALRPVLTPFMS